MTNMSMPLNDTNVAKPDINRTFFLYGDLKVSGSQTLYAMQFVKSNEEKMPKEELEKYKTALVDLYKRTVDLDYSPEESAQPFMKETIELTITDIKSIKTKSAAIQGFLDFDEDLRHSSVNRSDYGTDEWYQSAISERKKVDEIYQYIYRTYDIDIYEFAAKKNKKIQKIIQRGNIETIAEYRLVHDFLSDLPAGGNIASVTAINKMISDFDKKHVE
ncbi:MAG: hypothetical protein ABJ370_08865 [Paracoccaceae bacterium]